MPAGTVVVASIGLVSCRLRSNSVDDNWPKPVAPVRCSEVLLRASGNDAMRVDGRVAAEIVVADVIHMHGACHAGQLVDVAQQATQVGIVGDALAVALEVGHVHGIEAYQCGPQPQVSLG